MIYDPSLDKLKTKVLTGERITGADAEHLYRLPLDELGYLADRRRMRAKESYQGRGNEIVTYIVDGNVNYEYLQRLCKFCALGQKGLRCM